MHTSKSAANGHRHRNGNGCRIAANGQTINPTLAPLDTVSDGATASALASPETAQTAPQNSENCPGAPTSTPANPAAEPATEGRTSGGRFAPGNRCGRGNPFTRKLGALRRAFTEAVGEAELKALARALYQRALGGDTAAAKLLLSYVLGRPPEAPDPDQADAQEWQMIQSWPAHVEVCAALVGQVPLDFATRYCSDLHNVAVETFAQRVVSALDNLAKGPTANQGPQSVAVPPGRS